MNEKAKEALELVDRLCQQASMNRAGHKQVEAAIETLKREMSPEPQEEQDESQ